MVTNMMQVYTPAVARSCNAQPENLANTLVNLGGGIYINHSPSTPNLVDTFGSFGVRARCRWGQWCTCGTRAQVNGGAVNCALTD